MKTKCNITGVLTGALALALLLFSNPSAAADNYKVDPNLPLAVRFSLSEKLRHPDYKTIDGNTALKWNYTHGLLCQSILDTYDYYHSDTLDCSALYTYAKGYYEATINSAGTIYNYKKSNYSLDHINAGKSLFRLYERTADKRYLIAMQTLRDHLKDQPRTSDGGFWHKQTYPYQMWLDGLYMAEPFYAQYARDFEDDPSESYADIVKQFVLVAEHTKDDHSGLYRHGWDEKRVQIWADKTTGQSRQVWGRALGWYTMALVDVLEIMPEEVDGRDRLLTILQDIFDVLPRYQDDTTGAWYQVVDYPDSTDNYLEISCTAMFALSIAKGVRLGYLDETLLPVARKAYQGMLDNYLTVAPDGMVSLNNICSVAGLSSDRDGSYDYYVHQTVTISNDPKGVGPFIMLCLEMDRLDRQAAGGGDDDPENPGDGGDDGGDDPENPGDGGGDEGDDPENASVGAIETAAPYISAQGGQIVLHYCPQEASAQITVASLDGRLLATTAFSAGEAGLSQKVLPVDALPAGLYFASVNDGGKTTTLKFNKQ